MEVVTEQIAHLRDAGLAAERQGDGKGALAAYLRALALDAGNLEVLVLLGNLYKRLRQPDSARRTYQQALAVAPTCIEAHFNLATLDQDAADYPQAIQAYQRVLQQAPGIAQAWHNLVACLTYAPDSPRTAVKTALTGFDRILTPCRPRRDFRNDFTPERRLRIAYVSADFRAHPVGYLALPLIEGHDRTRFEVSCYFSHRIQDDWTAKFRKAADHWVNVTQLDDAALAQRIADDSIDILVDLAGHSEGNRLLAFAKCPAPVQISWMGYVTTTGLSAMDWRLTHADADPSGAEIDYTERLWRLPSSLWCYRPLPRMPDVQPSPLLQKGHLTFGVLNRYAKNSQPALLAWAEILRRVPDSRLLINAPQGEPQRRLAQFYCEQGIDLARIDCFTHSDHDRFWRLHHAVDIALDPFPFNGGMTTCETLWMGVPVVTCSGGDLSLECFTFPSRFASRMGRAMLQAIGRPEWVADTIPGYIDCAVRMASQPEQLVRWREAQRRQMAQSRLMDERAFVADVEAAYRAMWHECCEMTDA
ncbi:MAG TPA: tetratricopeptide repeat protein [Noviherbaspirillum sp.]|nr:tetratricopeptide repeat protein [Noviherbaspirillum sp.]